MSALILMLTFVGALSIGLAIGQMVEARRAERRLLIIDRFCMAARNAAGKLRAEIKRGTVEPKAEYDNLIEESERHQWRPPV